MSEKTILAYFKAPKDAEQVERRLQALRVSDTSIDQVDRYPGDGVGRISNPITGNIESLNELTQDADFTTKSAAILAAADANASGMSDGGQGGPTGRNYLLTVVVDESQHERALTLIERGGGLV